MVRDSSADHGAPAGRNRPFGSSIDVYAPGYEFLAPGELVEDASVHPGYQKLWSRAVAEAF
ncbi:MAG: hypothetical protein LBI92_10715 [Azoarcus sp.]|jgi:hypothetical protein|nr:hypothetical protein [Azoarcus sp.]